MILVAIYTQDVNESGFYTNLQGYEIFDENNMPKNGESYDLNFNKIDIDDMKEPSQCKNLNDDVKYYTYQNHSMGMGIRGSMWSNIKFINGLGMEIPMDEAKILQKYGLLIEQHPHPNSIQI